MRRCESEIRCSCWPTPPHRLDRCLPPIYLYVHDSDAVYHSALNAGGVSVFPIMTLPSGERYGGVKDPCGNIWWVATHVEDVPPDEQRTALERIQNAVDEQ